MSKNVNNRKVAFCRTRLGVNTFKGCWSLRDFPHFKTDMEKQDEQYFTTFPKKFWPIHIL